MADNDQAAPPPRADFKKQPVFAIASIVDQAGYRPGFHREWFHKDDINNPQYFRKFLTPHYVGDKEVKYCRADAWQVVRREDAKPGRPRDDDGKGLEGALTHGDLVCLETPDENAAIYRRYKELRDQAQTRKLTAGDNEAIRDEHGRPVARYRARVGDTQTFQDERHMLTPEG